MADDCCSKKGETLTELARKKDQRRVLVIVMVINLAMFFAEFGGGLVARSSALMADSVDMLGDAFVYALSLYALHRGARWGSGVRRRHEQPLPGGGGTCPVPGRWSPVGAARGLTRTG